MSKRGALSILGAAGVVGVYVALKESRDQKREEQVVIRPAGYVTGGSKAKLAALEASSAQPDPKSALIGWGVDTLFGAIERNGLFGGWSKNQTPPIVPTSKPKRDRAPALSANTDSRPRSSGTGIGNRLVNDLMADFGFTRPQAAGVVGNLDHESDGFRGLQEYNPTVKGSRGGYGYAQWTGPRRRQFEAWAAEQGHSDLSTYAANYGFLKYEMTQTWEKRAVGRVKQTSTAAESARVFQDTFLRPGIPHTSSRIKRAEGYL